MMWGNPYGGGGAFGWGAMMAMSLFGLLVVIGIVLLIVWAVRSGGHQHTQGYYRQHPPQQPQQQQRDAALDAARERYARGEITREQYAEIVRDLGYPTPPAAS